jgi:hypothetical protein
LTAEVPNKAFTRAGYRYHGKNILEVPVDPDVKARLLASIEANRLVLMLGAGLSMAPPSSLPSAMGVAARCFDEYTAMANPACSPALRTDLEALAQHFVDQKTLKAVFIDRLVPWSLFVRPPNIGHLAIADFLLTRAAASALSTNYDILVERAAWDYGGQFVSSLDGDEANVQAADHSPLLKFHGCSQRDRNNTVWSKSQLAEAAIADRIAKSTNWITANLREKDLLVVGFWSDWSYFNDILGRALANVSPLSVVLVDPENPASLQSKAPGLWGLAHKADVTFIHIQESGATVLDELRRAFSQGFLRRVLRAGIQPLEAETHEPCDPTWLDVADLDSESLYGQRRDAEGIPATLPAKQRNPGASELLGFFHLLLKRAGAVQVPEGYELNGQGVRVVNGAGSILSQLRNRFLEAPVLSSAATIVAAIGATDLGVPGNVVRAGRPSDIVRPAAPARWLDFRDARAFFNI